MGEPNGANSLDDMRFKIFIVLHIILCIVVFFITKELTMFTYGFLGPFTILFGGIIYIIGSVFGVAVMIVVSAALLIPFWAVTVTKTSRVTEFEVDDTLKVMFAGVIVTVIAGMIFCGFGCLILMAMLFVPVLIMEGVMYWSSLRANYLAGWEYLPPEEAVQTVKAAPEEKPEENPEEIVQSMQKADIVRFAAFIVIHIVLCAAIFCYAIDLGKLPPGGTEITIGQHIVIAVRKLYILAMWGWSVLLLIPFKHIALRNTIRASAFEIKWTLAIVAAGVVLTVAVCMFYLGLGRFWFMVEMFVPVLIFELALYWAALRGGNR